MSHSRATSTQDPIQPMGAPETTATAREQHAPAVTAPRTRTGSGIAEPDPLQTWQVEQPPHPEIAGAHGRQHPEQEELTRRGAERVEVRRVQRREDDEERDW